MESIESAVARRHADFERADGAACLTVIGDRTQDGDPPGLDAVPALSVRGLTKTYRGGFTAIKGLNLDIPDGAFFGLLGPNGAGKTTLIGAVCNLLRPTAGEIRVFGHHHESREARRLVGLAEQEINLDRFLSVAEILVYHAGYHGIGRREARRRAGELLDLFRLGGKAKSRHTELSGGMQRRLLLARALMHRPRLIILDEPTAGVDVELRAEIWRYTRELNELGATILLTTHYLEEAEALCGDIALLRAGQIIARGSPHSLRRQFGVGDLAGVYARAMADEEGAWATGGAQ
jgi:ABC-2 type transport system ATP-binding protein